MTSPHVQELWKIVNNDDDNSSKRIYLAEIIAIYKRVSTLHSYVDSQSSR